MSLSKSKKLQKYPRKTVYSVQRIAEVRLELMEKERGRSGHSLSKRAQVLLRTRDLDRQFEHSK